MPNGNGSKSREREREREREGAEVVEPTYYMKRCFVSLGFDSDSGEDLDMKMHCFNAKPCISFLIFPRIIDPLPHVDNQYKSEL
jgi:hypothetical protein